VVLYCDTTIALPLITHYLLANDVSREPKRLYERRHELMAGLRQAFEENLENRRAEGAFDLDRMSP
jgi:hypothetical protein